MVRWTCSGRVDLLGDIYEGSFFFTGARGRDSQGISRVDSQVMSSDVHIYGYN